MDDLQSAAATYLTEYGWMLTILMMAGLLLAATMLRPLRRRSHSRAVLAQLDAATRSKLMNAQCNTTKAPAIGLNGDFEAAFFPAPHPFASLTVTRSHSLLSGFFAPSRRKRRGQIRDGLLFRGILLTPPQQELLWARGETPDRALRRGEGSSLWTHHRMDLTGSEYITRGDNTGALQHAFFDLQRRYGPFLRQVCVDGEHLHHVTVRIHLAHGLNVEEMSALVNLIRTVGRAAQLD